MNLEQASGSADRIVDLVREHWSTNQSPLLLSKLGSFDNGQIARHAKSESGGLAAYLRNRLAENVRVIRHSSNTVLIAAVPADAEIAEDEIDDALERTNTNVRLAAGTRRLVSGFWNAFRVPLGEGKTRYVGLKTPIRFQDLGPEEPPPRDFKEIPSDDILGLDGSIEQIRGKISDWLERNELSETEFVVKSGREDARLPADDLLGRLIVALEPDELKRMSIPMDIVGKLRRKPN